MLLRRSDASLIAQHVLHVDRVEARDRGAVLLQKLDLVADVVLAEGRLRPVLPILPERKIDRGFVDLRIGPRERGLGFVGLLFQESRDPLIISLLVELGP